MIPISAPAPANLRVIQAMAPSLRVEVSPINMRDAGEIERAVDGFRARSERRSDRDGWCDGPQRSSRSDHRAGGAAQAACGLLRIATLSPPAA